MSESTSTRYHFNDTARRTTLAADVAQGDGTVEVDEATNLPSTPFLVAVWAEQSGGEFKYVEDDMELMEVTGVNGTTLTVTRGVAGTSAMSFTAGDLVETSVQTAQVMDHKLPTVSAAEYTDDAANGGAAIQAAIDDLPSRGGIVHIPVMGPDDGVTDHFGNTQNNVWAVTSPITDGGKESVWLVGGGPGSVESGMSGGTRLIATSSISNVLRFESGNTSGCKDILFDGGNDSGSSFVTDCVDLGDGNPVKGFYLNNCVFLGGSTQGVLTSCDQKVWINNCQFRDTLDGNNGITIPVTEKVWVTGCAFDDSNIGLDINDSSDISVSKCVFESVDRTAVYTVSGASVTGLTVRDIRVIGNGITDHAVEAEGAFAGSLVDSTFENVRASGLNQTKFENIVNDLSKTTRVTINGLGYNGANNPASAGDWNGNGKEGIRVLWTSNGDEVISEYRNGSWEIEDAVALIQLGYNVGGGGLPLDTVQRDTIGGVSTSRDTGNNEITISSNVSFQTGNAVPVVVPVQSGVAAYGRVRYSSGNIILEFRDNNGTIIDIDADDWEVYVKVEYHD